MIITNFIKVARVVSSDEAPAAVVVVSTGVGILETTAAAILSPR